MKASTSKHVLDNRADQLNPTHAAYYLSRGASPEEAERLAAEAQVERGRQPEPGANPASDPEAGGAKR